MDAGVLVERADGTLLSLRERIDNHVESSLSALETSARLAGRLVDELAAFHETNRTQPQDVKVPISPLTRQMPPV